MEKIYETIACIKNAFPNGIDDVYEDLIICLKDDFTKQNLAALLSYVCGKEPIVIQNDIDHCQSDVIPHEVMDALTRYGYRKGTAS